MTPNAVATKNNDDGSFSETLPPINPPASSTQYKIVR